MSILLRYLKQMMQILFDAIDSLTVRLHFPHILQICVLWIFRKLFQIVNFDCEIFQDSFSYRLAILMAYDRIGWYLSVRKEAYLDFHRLRWSSYGRPGTRWAQMSGGFSWATRWWISSFHWMLCLTTLESPFLFSRDLHGIVNAPA